MNYIEEIYKNQNGIADAINNQAKAYRERTMLQQYGIGGLILEFADTISEGGFYAWGRDAIINSGISNPVVSLWKDGHYLATVSNADDDYMNNSLYNIGEYNFVGTYKLRSFVNGICIESEPVEITHDTVDWTKIRYNYNNDGLTEFIFPDFKKYGYAWLFWKNPEDQIYNFREELDCTNPSCIDNFLDGTADTQDVILVCFNDIYQDPFNRNGDELVNFNTDGIIQTYDENIHQVFSLPGQVIMKTITVEKYNMPDPPQEETPQEEQPGE